MNFSATNHELWSPILSFGIISVVMLFSTFLIRKIVFFRKALVPTAVLAGFILLLLREIGILPIGAEFLESITYHAIGLGFIAMSLRIPNERDAEFKRDMVGAKSGAIIVGSYLVQGIIGLVITAGLAYTVFPDLFKAAGILLPMGYGQGPGQANNIGTIYENDYGFKGGQSFGLSIAAAGYLCACVIGVIYLNILRRKNKIRTGNHSFVSGSVTVDTFQDENEIPISQSVDRFSVQIALVLGVYLATYAVSWGITTFLSTYLPGIGNSVNSIIWGFNFIVGSLIAIICRSAVKGLTKTGFMTRRYQNNYLLSRISGVAFDMMIICGIASIDISDLSGLWIPFIILSVVGAVVTFVYLQKVCKKVYGDYYYEGLVSMFGMMTGTISSGVLLLREIDQDFETPAANNLVTGSSFAILFGVPMLLLINLAPGSELKLFITLGLMIVYFALLMLFVYKVKRRPRGTKKAAHPDGAQPK